MVLPLASATGAIVAVVIGIALGVALAAYLARRRRRREPAKVAAANAEQAKRASARGLRVGDVVGFDGHEFVVQGTLRFQQDGFTWEEHLVVDSATKRWLSVEDDEGLELVWWEKLIDPDLVPGEKRLDHEGTTYQLEERGHANYTSEGTTGAAAGGRMEFVDYEAGDLRLSFERYGQEDSAWELSSGRVIGEAVLDVYPADGPPQA